MALMVKTALFSFCLMADYLPCSEFDPPKGLINWIVTQGRYASKVISTNTVMRNPDADLFGSIRPPRPFVKWTPADAPQSSREWVGQAARTAEQKNEPSPNCRGIPETSGNF